MLDWSVAAWLWHCGANSIPVVLRKSSRTGEAVQKTGSLMVLVTGEDHLQRSTACNRVHANAHKAFLALPGLDYSDLGRLGGIIKITIVEPHLRSLTRHAVACRLTETSSGHDDCCTFSSKTAASKVISKNDNATHVAFL